METMDVLLTGRTLPGADTSQAAASLARMAGISQDQALALLSSGKAKLVKRGLSETSAQALADQLAALGIESQLRSAGQKAAPPPDAEAPVKARSTVPDKSPVIRAERPVINNEAEFNPYTAPKADLRPAPARARQYAGGELWYESGIRVPAGHGIKWINDAWKLYKERWGLWTLCLFIVGAINGFLGALPVIGLVISWLINPVFGGGLAMMAHRQLAGEDIRLGEMFKGFGMRGLWALGLIFLGSICAIWLLCSILAALTGNADIGELGRLLQHASKLGPEDQRSLGEHILNSWPVLLLAFILFLLVSVIYFFASTLVAQAGMSPMRAARAGGLAALRNLLTFLVNIMGFCAVCVGATIIIVFISGIGAAFMGNAAIFISFLLILLLFIPVGAVIMLVPYMGTRDIFYRGA